MNYGKQFRELRESKGLSRHELSTRAGVSHSTIVKIELEETTPTAFTIYKLAKALGVEELDLIKIFERN